MLCEICHQNEASFHVHIFVDGVSKMLHVCEKCAVKRNVERISEPEKPKDPFSLFAAEKVHRDQAFFEGSNSEAFPPEVMCPCCGRNYQEIAASGRLGCSLCWDLFSPELDKVLDNVFGTYEHIPDEPECDAVAQNIDVLQRALEDAVRAENYESAARLRDKIQKLSRAGESL